MTEFSFLGELIILISHLLIVGWQLDWLQLDNLFCNVVWIEWLDVQQIDFENVYFLKCKKIPAGISLF